MTGTLDKTEYIALLESEVRRAECDCHKAQQQAGHDRQSMEFLQAELRRAYQSLDEAKARAVAACRKRSIWQKRAVVAMIVAGVEGWIILLGVMAWVAYR